MADDQGELLPSQVRARVLKDHAALRLLIADVRRAAQRARQGGSERGDSEQAAFVDAAHTLLRALREHLALEDEILLPTLRTIDAWGPERAKRLETEHAHQREVLEMTETQLDDPERPIGETVARMEQFVDRLEKDMMLEEKTDLDEELLREFPIRTDFGGA